jgi:teichuronic acid biosynthesis glycosyltransferase TuaC
MNDNEQLNILMISTGWPSNGRQEISVTPFIDRQIKFLRNEGLNVDFVSFLGHRNVFRYFSAWVKIQFLINKNRYHLIHAQFGHNGLLPLLPKRLPLVVTFRGSDVLGFIEKDSRSPLICKLQKHINNFVAKFADQVIVVSKHLIAHLPEREYHVIPSGIDLIMFSPMLQVEAREILGLDQGKTLVLFNGSKGRAVKRLPLALQVMDLIRNQFPDASLVVLEGVPHERVPLFMNACDALLVTSIHEGSPGMVKEAIACNLPIVSTDVGDVRERIKSFSGCKVVDDDNPETIAKALVKILGQRTRINGRHSLVELDEKIITKKVIDIYRLCI